MHISAADTDAMDAYQRFARIGRLGRGRAGEPKLAWLIEDNRLHFHNFLYNRNYAIALSNTALPVAAWYFPFHLWFVFGSQSQKRTTKKKKYRSE